MSRPTPTPGTRRLTLVSHSRCDEFPIAEMRREASKEVRAEFDEIVDDISWYAEYRRLATEQASVRRLTELVARGVEPSQVFAAVAEEMRQCLSADTAEIWRFDTDYEITMLAAAADREVAPVSRAGARIPLESNIIAMRIRQTGEPARSGPDDSDRGPIAHRVCETSENAAVGAPIVIDQRLWGLAVAGFKRGNMPAEAEARVSHFADQAVSVVVACHRDEQKRLLLAEASRCSASIGLILEGRAQDDWSLREVAGQLRLPACGRFVVIAAQARTTGDAPLPEIEPKLRSLDIPSAWQLLPDFQVGIVHVKSEDQLGTVSGLVARTATGRVGVSAIFEDLRDTPRALHVARIMAHGSIDPGSGVRVFDGSILATAAVSAPDVMIKSAGAALDGFGHLPDYDQETLFETFRVWLDCDASATAAAEVLVCHPNTVRQRLRRIEKCTGRSLSRPRDVAELCLVFEVRRHLM